MDSCFANTQQLMMADDALRSLQTHAQIVTSIEQLPLKLCHHRIVAHAIHSPRSIPSFDNSAMDGYAIRFSDLQENQPTHLALQAVARAGHPANEMLQPTCAIRILTGAQIPQGADTIVPQEEVLLENNKIIIAASIKKGSHIRLTGEDIKKEDVIIKQGQRCRPQDIAVAAAAGLSELPVFTRLRVALFSTGDELHEPGTHLPSDGVYDANRYLLHACLEKLNCAITDYGILNDNPEHLKKALHDASLTHDVIITSGGASTSSEDHIANTVRALGQLHFWRLAIKPGRPLAFGEINNALFVGLPGNPVAVMVCFLRFVSPLLTSLNGGKWKAPTAYSVRADFSLLKKNNRREWLRAQLIDHAGQLSVKPYHKKGTGIISSLTQSVGLIEVPEAVTSINAGDFVSFIPYDHFY